jgi:hypothetical protein
MKKKKKKKKKNGHVHWTLSHIMCYINENLLSYGTSQNFSAKATIQQHHQARSSENFALASLVARCSAKLVIALP